MIEVPREVYDSLVALLRDNPREPEFDGDSVVYDDGLAQSGVPVRHPAPIRERTEAIMSAVRLNEMDDMTLLASIMLFYLKATDQMDDAVLFQKAFLQKFGGWDDVKIVTWIHTVRQKVQVAIERASS